MNSNRSQYTSAPAYGIQKKGYAKKMGFTQDKVTYVPDFDAYPAQNTQVPVTNQAEMFSSVPDYNTPVQQYIPYSEPPVSIQSPVNPAMQQFQAVQQGGQQQNFWGYSQTPQNYPWGNVQQAQPQSWQQFQAQQPVQAGIPQVNWNAYDAQSNGARVNPPARQAVSAQPVPQTPPVPPKQPPIQQQPVERHSKQPENKQKMSATQLITLFLYGILPILFIVSFFRTPLFYAFIALALVGFVLLWYREMYSKPLRFIVTALLALLCIVGVVKLVRATGNNDTLLGSTPAKNSQVVVTVDPQYIATENPDLLATAVPVTPAPTAAISEAERRLSAFMDLWATSNAEAMVKLVQPSWVNKQSDAAQALFILLANRKATSYEIESITGTESDTSRAVTMTAVIDKNTGKNVTTYRFTVMMVKEGDEWYVNPNSLATNDEVSTTEDEVVVNDSNASGLATAAPRVTVSPVPAGSTLLYYNPDGGSYYHLDANCPSVRSEFLPLSGTFTYAELGNYRSKLTPCIRCNAPSNTLAPNAE